MLMEALEYLRNKFVEGVEVEELRISGLRNRSLVHTGQGLKEYAHDVPPRMHYCEDLQSLGAWISGEDNIAVWFNMDGITVVLNDDKQRDDQVLMDLNPSAEWQAATQGVQGNDQKKFIDWCVHHLRRELESAHPGFVDLIRNVKFSGSNQAGGNIQKGNESFGKEIEAQVAGADSFPDELIVKVPVWKELPYSVDVELMFYVDPHNQSFTLKPFAGSLQKATTAALGELREAVAEYQDEGRMYCGSPGELFKLPDQD